MIKFYDKKGKVERIELTKTEKLALAKENNKLIKEQRSAKSSK